MTVMLYGLAEIRVELSLLEMGVQLMILPTTSFHTMHPILVFQDFSVVPGLVSHIHDNFSKPCPSDLSKALNVPLIAF